MDNKKSKLVQYHIAMLITAIMYAANYSIAKILMPMPISAYALVLIRLLCATLIIFIIMFFKGVKLPDFKNDGLLFTWCALTGVVINMLLFFKGLSMSTAMDAAIIMTITPPCTYAISIISGSEAASINKIIGAALALIGVYLLITKFSIKIPNINIGNILLLINAVAYSFYIPLVKKLGKKYDSLTVCAWTFALGIPFVAIFGINDFLLIDWISFTNQQWLALAFVVLGVTVLTYLLISYATKILSSSTVAYYSYLQPLVAIFIAVMFYGESIEIYHILSGAIVFTGLWLLNFSQQRR